jgi:non-ribosomal peptide synthetase component F
LTAERFIANPFCGGARRLLYKTGDVGRYREDGNIEFLGRADNQVKVRGFRIELGEIESTLTAHESIKHAAVVVRSNDTMTDCLVAYVVPADGLAVVRSELRRFLKTRLPDYMVPSVFVTLDALPLSPNGKLDQRALPNPELAQPEVSGNYVAPRNTTEAKLVEIWTEVLKVGRIGVLDNFFELGGHSLMAARVVSRVRKYLGVELSMRSLFEEPTIAALAVVLEKTDNNRPTVRTRITPKPPDRRAREQLDAQLRELSDEEVDALLKMALADRTQSQLSRN